MNIWKQIIDLAALTRDSFKKKKRASSIRDIIPYNIGEDDLVLFRTIQDPISASQQLIDAVEQINPEFYPEVLLINYLPVECLLYIYENIGYDIGIYSGLQDQVNFKRLPQIIQDRINDYIDHKIYDDYNGHKSLYYEL